jgi:hypothetical protein
MLTAFIAVALHSHLALATFKSDPIDVPADSSVWVYSHASDPSHDPYLRIWGAGGLPISGAGPSDDWSYGYLRWNLASVKDPQNIKSAVLILHNVSPAALKADSEPLQARALKGTFSADTWNYSNANDVVPGPDETVFGEGKATDLTAKPVEIRIKLDRKFLDYLLKAKDSKALYLALTSKIDPNVEGASADKGGVYKVYSAAAELANRPILHLEY